MPKKDRCESVSAWGYLIAFAVLLFIAAMIAAQAAYPCYKGQCYNALTNPISDLGNTATSPLWPLFNYSLVLFGLLVIVGMLGVKEVFGSSNLSNIGVALVIIGMLGSIGVGVVPENTILAIHSIFALVAFGLGGPAAILIGYSMLRRSGWYACFSVAAGVIAIIAFLSFIAPQFGLIQSWQLTGNGFGFGGAERAIAAPVLLWLFVTGLSVGRLSRKRR